MSLQPYLIGLMLAQASAMPADPRIQTHKYSQGAVVNLAVSPGYATVIELGHGEQIDTVVVGNSAVWQITETGNGSSLVVKPLSGASPTNMIVITDARRYAFLLDPAGSPDQTSFIVRFDDGGTSQSAAKTGAATFKLSGNRRLFPATMRDDGTRTRIRWPRQTPLPAIVAVGDGQVEALVNGRMVGEDYVIEGTSAQFKFRYGDAEATAIRQTRRIKK